MISPNDHEIKHLIDKMKNIGKDALLQSAIDNVIDLTYEIKNADEILMDQYESVLERARDNGDENLYKIALILRIVAHKAHEIYIRAGKEVNNKRFLHIVK